MLAATDKSSWTEICEPVWLCMLPLTSSDLLALFDLSFTETTETGVGSVWYAYALLGEKDHDKPLMFKTYSLEATEQQYLSVYILGQETDWDIILEQLCFACNITEDELMHKESMLVPGQWLLSRLDDNDNELEMFRFPDDFRAEQARSTYEKRGHKQTYVVREL